MASVPSQLLEEVTAHVQSDSLEDAQEICADGIYFPNNLRTSLFVATGLMSCRLVKRTVLTEDQCFFWGGWGYGSVSFRT